MEIYLLAGLMMVAAALIIYSLLPKNNDNEKVIKRRMTGRSAQSSVAAIRKEAKESVAKKMLDSVAPIAMRPAKMQNSEEMSKLRMKLANAGIRGEGVVTTFLASKTMLALLLGIAGLLYSWGNGVGLLHGSGYTMLAAGFGFLAPNVWLSLAISKRSNLIRNGLPDTLDLLVISVESGLGLDAALQRVGDEMTHVHPAVSEEMQMVTVESQMGVPRSEALANFAARSGVEEARSLVGVVNQAERFGTSIATALRRQSESLRMKRRQAAEEKAQKTTVKLMLPLIMFIFPAILVVLAGPAGLRMYEMFTSGAL